MVDDGTSPNDKVHALSHDFSTASVSFTAKCCDPPQQVVKPTQTVAVQEHHVRVQLHLTV